MQASEIGRIAEEYALKWEKERLAGARASTISRGARYPGVRCQPLSVNVTLTAVCELC
jgi:hypothetical protein